MLDFPELVEAASCAFVGREPVFARLDAFRAASVCGYFEVVADAGLGKTALAAEIARRNDALCFFANASRGLTAAEQFLTHLCATIIIRYGLKYDRLPSKAGEDATYLGRLLKEVAAKSAPVWIVVDGLDEAERPPTNANPLLLPTHLPHGVYVVVTHRPTGGHLLTQPNTPKASYEILWDAPDQKMAIETYLEQRVARDEQIKATLADLRPPLGADAFVERLKSASKGNFMYLSYVLADMISPREAGQPSLDLDKLPQGLQGYYEQFWSKMKEAQAEGWADWDTLYRPVIERLAVAAEAVTADWLGAQTGRDPQAITERALSRWTRLLGSERVGGVETWRVVHRSFADFLADKVNLRSANRAVGEHYTDRLSNKWTEWDNYGLRHAPQHLAAAAADPLARHVLTEKLVSLVLDAQYERQHLKRLRDPNAFERVLELALRTAAHDDGLSPILLAEVALRVVAFGKEQRRAQPVFDLAVQGDVDGAERRLDLFALEMDAAWYQALLLTIAWLGASKNIEGARGLRDRTRKAIAIAPPSPVLQCLSQWVDAAIDKTPVPVTSLPPPPPLEEARSIVARLTDSAVDRSLLAGADIELFASREMMAGSKGYLAELDGPDLVALTAADPGLGEPLLQQYVALHAAYGYREYRQGSLWALLDAVLQHPRVEWVRSWVPALGAAALAPNRGEFRESLGITTLALRRLAGEAGAVEQLDQALSQAVDAVGTTDVIAAGAGRRGQGDTWGTHRRRLSAFAEAFSRLPGGRATSATLITRALGLRYGFAGFNAPACTALAEAIEISSPDFGWIAQALAAARSSAHNIQDSTFCARTTARVNAMASRWWGAPAVGAFDVVDLAERLAVDPSAPDFAAQHKVGETYADRDPQFTIPLSDKLLNATSLTQLAEVYQRPLEDFRRLNIDQGWDAEQPLPQGTLVNIPDPGFPPLIAARFVARALADPSLSPEEQQATIRILVPIAAAEATVLDTVLSRFFLAAGAQDQDVLAALTELAKGSQATSAPDLELQVRLTAFIP
ncbi:hypothetical protein [Rhizobium jaguaris]|uniref:Uncharacterized protein n=1 Tax=Rhizobium jaguaris TaxID=1312183 RepID=A0A387G521_9HYPH|nr:hypothetical protein [Rhizobium jaguaris]AYG64445.1 hypothetical protein CCGE525_37595 [Rhizobium jaguaris]